LLYRISLTAFVAFAAGIPAFGQQYPLAHFHHIHLNSTDPAAAIEFYTSKFDCEKAKFAGEWDGVWAQKAWGLFNKVATPPPAEITSTIWHFGWGAEDMQATYQKQLNSGTKFNTPLTDISDLANSPGFYYAYVDGPDHALMDLKVCVRGSAKIRPGAVILSEAKDPFITNQLHRSFAAWRPLRMTASEI